MRGNADQSNSEYGHFSRSVGGSMIKHGEGNAFFEEKTLTRNSLLKLSLIFGRV